MGSLSKIVHPGVTKRTQRREREFVL